MFSGHQSVSAHLHPCIQARVLLVRYLPNQWTEFHQTLVDDLVEVTDKLTRFRRSRGQSQGHSKVTYLSELLRQVEASTLTLGH